MRRPSPELEARLEEAGWMKQVPWSLHARDVEAKIAAQVASCPSVLNARALLERLRLIRHCQRQGLSHGLPALASCVRCTVARGNGTPASADTLAASLDVTCSTERGELT